jgi:molybdopterin synthase sulfur carrier subunit
MIRFVLPPHLRQLAHVDREVEVQVMEPVTLRRALDALEADYPVLRGTIRDYATQERRAFIRFFAGGEDLSHEPLDTPLPAAIASGAEHLMVVGAMAGG